VNIAFVSYETPFAPCGGIAAVMGRLPARVQAASHVETIVVTPFHHRIEKMGPSACRSPIGR
jgi:glycogen synthase